MSATLLRIIDESAAGDVISEIAVSFASPSVTVQDIIAARGADATPDKLYLPFEGDRTLTLMISKAVLLAEDHKITNTTILSQIRR